MQPFLALSAGKVYNAAMRTFMPRIPHGMFALMVVLLLAACGSGGDGTAPAAAGPFKLTFSLNGSFHAPHGDDPISMALVRVSDAVVIANTSGTVSATQNPSFSFVTGAVMERGAAYAVHYWIDSNILGGTLGACDAKAIDHQWSTEFPSVSSDKNLTVFYQPALVEDVCSTFLGL
jgi:hypothetical protein